MPIAGIGTDIVRIQRIRDILQRHPEKFVKRILSPNECVEFHQCADRAAFLAKRFAAKEAASKALGTGIGKNAAFTDFSVAHHNSGQPYLQISGSARETMDKRGIQAAHISLSDESEHALAFVVFESVAQTLPVGEADS